ncbi:MAG: general secretion pathway protein GspB [Desulfuromusa sp.]|nr:general secretion pathway protein GspB [Desulfuromusa sp.]
MSYILNALKKSENKSFERDVKIKKQVLILKRGTKRKKIKIFFLFAILLGTLVAGWFLGHLQSSQPNNAADSITSQRSLDNQLVVHDSKEQLLEKVQLEEYAKEPEKLVNNNNFYDGIDDKKIRKAEYNTNELSPPIPVRAAPSPVKTLSEEGSHKALEPAEIKKETDSIQYYSELPFLIKQKFPQLEISLHFYNSDPARRIVRINGKILHEKDRIVEGLTVQEIKPATTVLSYDGNFFKLKAPGG